MTTSQPLVSIVLAVFNGASTLGQSLESILNQTFQAWELIIIDDGSTDATVEILNELNLQDSRVRVIRQANLGLTRALITGCKIAKGTFIARQDADDWSEPSRLAKQIQLLESDHRLGLASSWAHYDGPGGEPLEVVRRPADCAEATAKLLDEKWGPPAHGSVMFRTSLYNAVGGYRREFYYAQDSDLWLRMCEVSLIGYVQEPLYHFRRHLESISTARGGLQSEFGALGQACRSARRSGKSEEPWLAKAAGLTRRITADQTRCQASQFENESALYLIGAQLAKNKDSRATVYLMDLLRRRPFKLTAWARLVQAVWNKIWV